MSNSSRGIGLVFLILFLAVRAAAQVKPAGRTKRQLL